MYNKRKFNRYSLQHDLLIVAKGFSPVAADMANICVGGMLLTNISSAKLCQYFLENPASRIEIHIFCEVDNSEQHFTVLADVCRADGRSAGIKFVQQQSQLLETMLRIGSQKKTDGVLYTTESKRKKLREWFRSNAQQFVNDLLLEILGETRNELELRTKASTDLREISLLRDAKAVVSMTDSFTSLYLKLWWSSLESILSGESGGQGDQRELKVIDKSQFEGWLEVQMVATAVLNRNRNELFLLNQFLSQIMEQDVDDRSNPIAPAILGQVLHSTSAQMSIPEIVQPILYREFEKVLDKAYEGVLRPIFGVFEKHGLRAIGMDQVRTNWNEPRPRSPLPANSGESAANEPAETLTPEEMPGTQIYPESNILNMVRLQRQVQSNEAGAAAGIGESATEQIGPPVISIEELLAKQNQILDQLSRGGSTLADALQQQITGDNQTWVISQNDKDIVDIVDKIFAPVAQRSVPEELRTLINQLRLPLFSVLNADPSFFADQNHAARNLLNNFMSLATADRVSGRNLEKLLKQVVAELVEAEQITPELLHGLAERLSKLVQRQDMAFNRNAERIAKTYDGQERLFSARRAIARRLNTLLEGQQVPDIILELLNAGWEHAMVLGLLKEGGDSETVAENFEVLEQLFIWLDANINEDTIFEREIESPAILEQIEKELSTSPNPNHARQVVQHLQDVLYNEGKVTYTQVEKYPPGEDLNLPSSVLHLPVDERWQERAHQLQVGEWVELFSDSGVQRMRLVWIGEDAFKFVFLTAHGMHEASYEYSEIVAKLQEGEMVKVEGGDVPFVDQSLYGIVEDLYQKMAVQAVHDGLTGCMQRREFEKRIEYTLAKVRQTGDTGALVVFDIDQFGVINSSYGTTAGDMVLQQFGILVDTWLEDFEQGFKLGRLAGNEFSLIVYPVAPERVMEIAENVRSNFANHRFDKAPQSFTATLSSGAVIIDGRAGDAGKLLNCATLACNAAKKSGGNSSRLYSTSDRDQAHQQEVLQWLTRIEGNLQDCNLFLRAQPIRHLLDESLPLYEILLGIRNDQGEVVSPESFIEAGETYNKSVQIDTWVVEHVLDWMRKNTAKLNDIKAFTINLSGRSLSDNQFMEFLENQFQEGGFPAEKVCFEVTETAAVASLNYTADFMREIKKSGCHFALDDFGTGFSSYAYLQKLPVDYLKVDGVFVRDLHENMTNYAMVKSIIELGRFLDIITIAECVEEQAGLEALKEIGVDYVQGYILGKPKPLLEL